MGGKIAERPHGNEMLLCHTHIARTGGSILLTWLKRELALQSHEECAAQIRERCSTIRATRVQYSTLLRSPREHVLSQYMECAYSTYGGQLYQRAPGYASIVPRSTAWMTNGASQNIWNVSSLVPSPSWELDAHVLDKHLSAWLQHFLPPRIHHNAPCYTPRNFQTRSLLCDVHNRSMAHLGNNHASSSTWIEDHHQQATADALRAIDALDLVGVLELEREFACVAIWRATRTLPAAMCGADACSVKEHGSARRQLGSTPAHSVASLSLRTLEMIDEVTALDGIVYTHALNISLRHIRATEVEANQSITCTAHLVALRRQLVYLPGALAALGEWILA